MNTKHDQTLFVEDEKGERYVCYLDDTEKHPHKLEKLSEKERKRCKPIEFPWN